MLEKLIDMVLQCSSSGHGHEAIELASKILDTMPKSSTPGFTFSIIMFSAGDSKINAIKALREVSHLGLKEAKEMVESNTPLELVRFNSLEETNAAMDILKGAGMDVAVRMAAL